MGIRSLVPLTLIAVLSVAAVPARLFAADPVPAAATAATAGTAKAGQPKIQVAILLDTSNSMDGLINQARTQLWKVVNEFAKARQEGSKPTLEVALFEYGNALLPPTEGYVRLVVPFTVDLDKVSQELFALQTNGGSEFCGQVIDRAVATLAWSTSNRDLRCMFIAGNEPFTQGPVDYRKACKAAAEGGITVSTIHCGPFDVGVQGEWQNGARLADGSYMSIDQNRAVADIPTPHDKPLADLSSQLNTTYLAYGSVKKQQEFAGNQVAQDGNATRAGAGVAAQRAATKASALYDNSMWDLCDACAKGTIKLEELQEDELPPELRKLSLAERKTYIEKKAKEREELQQTIKNLTAVREKFLADERAKRAKNDPTADDTLDTAIIKASRDQATRKNYTFEH